MARVRSPNYPSLSLPSAIEAVQKIYSKEHTHKAESLVMAKALGYGSLNGASMAALSALKKYGLLEDVGKDLKVSHAALSILVDPKDSKDRAKLIVQAACLPQLFSDLQDEYGPTVPSDENLKAFLIKRGFSPNTVDAPIRAYRDTIEFAAKHKALYDDVAEPPPAGQSNPAGQGTETGKPNQFEVEPPRTFENKRRLLPANEAAMRQDVFSIEEGAVTIEWPAQLSTDSLKDIEDWLTIVKRKIARSVAKPESPSEGDPLH